VNGFSRLIIQVKIHLGSNKAQLIFQLVTNFSPTSEYPAFDFAAKTQFMFLLFCAMTLVM
jgi:hypothetical protein